MRKFPLWCLFYFLLLTGCGDTHKEEQESIKNYESYVNAVLSSKGSESRIILLDYKLSVFKQKDNSYQYEIIISSPRTAMYNIQAITVDPALDSNSNAYPCLGSLGDGAKISFNMIPYRANGARNFVGKIFLDGIPEHDQFILWVTMTWKDSRLVNMSRVFFTCNYARKDNETNGQRNQKGYVI